MTLTLKEVEHIALLARLDLTTGEKKRYQQQLSHILDHVAQLQKLDTSHIELCIRRPAYEFAPARGRTPTRAEHR